MKPDRVVIKASANLHYLRFPGVVEDHFTARCLDCPSELILHQPDMDLPERLLGVCESCKHWYLIDLVRDDRRGVMIRLPDNEAVRKLSLQDSSGGIALMNDEADEEPSTPPDEPGSSP